METKCEVVHHKHKEFKFKKCYKNTTYYRCNYSRTLNCKAILVFDLISNDYKLLTDHNKKCLNFFIPYATKNETMENENTTKISLNCVPITSKTTLSNGSKDNFNELNGSTNQTFHLDDISTNTSNGKFISQNSIEVTKLMIESLKIPDAVYDEYKLKNIQNERECYFSFEKDAEFYDRESIQLKKELEIVNSEKKEMKDQIKKALQLKEEAEAKIKETVQYKEEEIKILKAENERLKKKENKSNYFENLHKRRIIHNKNEKNKKEIENNCSKNIAGLLNNIEGKKKRIYNLNSFSNFKNKKVSLTRRVTVTKEIKLKLQNYDNSKLRNLVENQDKTQIHLLLIIMEITKNRFIYNLQGNPKSKIFWRNIAKFDELKDVFIEFKNETLRKYWYLVLSLGNLDKIVELLETNKNLIQKNKIKLWPLIKSIESFIKNKETNKFEDYIKPKFKSKEKIELSEEEKKAHDKKNKSKNIQKDYFIKKEITSKINTKNFITQKRNRNKYFESKNDNTLHNKEDQTPKNQEKSNENNEKFKQTNRNLNKKIKTNINITSDKVISSSEEGEEVLKYIRKHAKNIGLKLGGYVDEETIRLTEERTRSVFICYYKEFLRVIVLCETILALTNKESKQNEHEVHDIEGENLYISNGKLQYYLGQNNEICFASKTKNYVDKYKKSDYECLLATGRIPKAILDELYFNTPNISN